METALKSTNATLNLGVTTGPLSRTGGRVASVREHGRYVRGEAGTSRVAMWYADWQHNKLPSTSQLNAIERRGSIPEITWEPWDASKGLYKSQPRYRLINIIDGKFDSYIRAWAKSLAALKHPVLLRFAQEMDGNWFPWGDYANGNHPGQFVQAWRHVHDILAGPAPPTSDGFGARRSPGRRRSSPAPRTST